ncbi:M3 family oligoendopeptidase [Ruminococcaceae bacterium OttesenSCG-928-I18]|nr:M3 family oligoendopeptidase [Ruminococcaceae bacterium OttesenSCG-928-I18]
MKFEEMPYTRPDIAAAAKALEKLAADAKRAKSGGELLQVFEAAGRLQDEIGTAGTLASVRHTVDTRDAYYSAENDYFDEQIPLFSDRVLSLYRALLASPHRAALDEAHGPILGQKLEVAVKSSDEKLIPLQQEENALETEYEKLYASARIPFQGRELTVAQLGPYKQHIDRATRKEAFEAEGGFFDEHREKLDELYDKMVKNRTEQARLMGFDTFTPLGDIRMERLGYTRKEIVACREEVALGIVPVAQTLYERQARRIGVPDFAFYDVPLAFKDGNPTPKGSPEEILAAGQKMYRALSKETAEFIDFMMERGLFDVLAKPGKAPGGYCTYIAGYKSPFIFSNFNGTAGDVDVLTHEAGHAFAAYLASGRDLPGELRSPGLESCEIHSMSMEFLTGEYHGLFFKEDTPKYELSHAEDTLTFLPYGCQVDEFQHLVYDQPGLSPQQRCELWLDLEKKYRPWNDFADLPFYSRGAGWQRQLHIYTSPFYYIDYVLAQAVALQFFLASQRDFEDAWQRYLRLTQKAGTEDYTGLVASAGLRTPFEPGVMRQVGQEMLHWLEAKDRF